MGRIVKENIPDLDEGDQAVRQNNCRCERIQKAKAINNENNQDSDERSQLPIHSIGWSSKVCDECPRLGHDLIDRINPFWQSLLNSSENYSEESLKRFAEVIAGKKINMTEEEARDLAIRAYQFKDERGRLPEITSADPWEKRMAEGIEYIRQKESRRQNNE